MPPRSVPLQPTIGNKILPCADVPKLMASPMASGDVCGINMPLPLDVLCLITSKTPVMLRDLRLHTSEAC